MLTTISKSQFIELHRTFDQLRSSDPKTDDARMMSHRSSNETWGWPKVLAEHRVILLSEAGSGKTEELRRAAQRLRHDGQSAFFLRLEHIVTDFEEAFEEGNYSEFQQWLAGQEEGWLLLDAVDEARLRSPQDFEKALRRVAKHLSSALQRTHIVIASRTAAWRPNTDRVLVENLLPFSSPRLAIEAIEEGKGDAGQQIKLKETGDNPEDNLTIVALKDLTREQIGLFAAAKGIADVKPLLEALERADALWAASRPQDLSEVIEFWKKFKRIGSRLELMRNSIERRLIERDQNRAEADPLTQVEARSGAKLAAGAMTMARTQTIRVPDGAQSLDGVPIASILPDWNDRECAVLLSRPIFDEAVYGSVRFHHRDVREYLAAEWITDLLKRDSSRQAIELIFFREQYGMEVIVPSARPILTWLILLDQRIRDRALRLAPELVFEGGDPSALPVDLRRTLLREMCATVVRDPTERISANLGAVQRFATTDLSADVIALLQQHAKHGDVTWLLLRMVWQGQFTDALPIVIQFASNPKTQKYSRIAAIRAVASLGAPDDLTRVRNSFLAESKNLNRELLAELIGESSPSKETSAWMLSAVSKTQPKPEFSSDGLASAVQAFVGQCDLEHLPDLVVGFSKLLRRRPVVERRQCEVSKRFRWLAKIAAFCVQRLAEAKHHAALDRPSLQVLRLQWMAEDRDDYALRQLELGLPGHIALWPKLRNALFWFEVDAERKALDKKKGERLINFWGVSMGPALWEWRIEDVELLFGYLSKRRLPDDKLIVLSILFNLYRAAGRPDKIRRRMARAVKDNAELEARLHGFLHPDPDADHERKWRKQERSWKAKRLAQERKETKQRENWKKYVTSNVELLRAPNVKPGQISSALYYLHHELEHGQGSSRWRDGSWESLTPKFGAAVAGAYRDGCIGYWRLNKPKLRSEGASANTTYFSEIFGITGISFEAAETASWPAYLTYQDAELATRYALFELNGYPEWMPALYAAFPKAVMHILLGEVRWELLHPPEQGESLYALYDVAWYGAWMWDDWAPIFVEELRLREPVAMKSLEQMLKVIQGSSLPDEQVRDLAQPKCASLTDLDGMAHWFAAWVGVDPEHAIPALDNQLTVIVDAQERVTFAMNFITRLVGGRHGESATARSRYRTATHLKTLYLIIHEHVRQREDIQRAGKGAYSPGLRDNAQDARNLLFNLLNEIPGKEAFLGLVEIAQAHPDKASRPWYDHHARVKAQQDADEGPWSISQFVDFNRDLERTPATNAELMNLAWLRMSDLKDDLENGDSSIASILKLVTLETDMRKFLGNWLRDNANGRYVVPQEEELADATKPDVRFHGVGFDAPVPMELKLADNWTGPHLFERLENQLSGDYLRDRRSNRGIFALVWRGDKQSWNLPGSKTLVGFDGLVEALRDHWTALSGKYPNVVDLRVIGIDLTRRATKSSSQC